MDVYAKLKQLGLQLPPPPPPGGLYTPVVEFDGSLCYTSGVGPTVAGQYEVFGKLGRELTLEEGQQAARMAALNLLSVLHAQLGDLNRIKRLVKLLAFVNSADDFYAQPQVINGASALFIELFGEREGRPARSAIGTNTLPGNIPVEMELVLEIE